MKKFVIWNNAIIIKKKIFFYYFICDVLAKNKTIYDFLTQVLSIPFPFYTILFGIVLLKFSNILSCEQKQLAFLGIGNSSVVPSFLFGYLYGFIWIYLITNEEEVLNPIIFLIAILVVQCSESEKKKIFISNIFMSKH